MIHCQNCGQTNSPASNFCRSCGVRFAAPPVPQYDNNNNYGNSYENSPPRPYAWKTDEYQTQNEPRKAKTINQVQPLATPFTPPVNPNAQTLVYQRPTGVMHNYHCPRCGANALPVIERRVSTAGWIVFALLLIFTWIFFWIGLLLKEEVRVCPVCRAKF